MSSSNTPNPWTRAWRNWKRWRESAVLAPLFGMSWRQLHSPTLFLWGRALQSNRRHWPAHVSSQPWIVEPHVIEAWRQELLSDSSFISRTDLGAGSRLDSIKRVEVRTSVLARRSLTPKRDVLALCRWLRCISGQGNFLELGTSLGITSAYVASSHWSVETWEGCPQTLEKAQEGWRKLGLDHRINSKIGPFQSHLDGLTSKQQWDVIFIDGCHEECATLEMVDALASHAVIGVVLDDITWSPGMHRAWNALRSRSEWRVAFSWRGRGFLIKSRHLSRQQLSLA